MTFTQRYERWKQLIIDDMIKRIEDETTRKDNDKRIELMNGFVGELIANNRIAKALGINLNQLTTKLEKDKVRNERKGSNPKTD